jgi:hypothetical protein
MADLPVFIGGFRSGTTLLVNLLGLHPQLTPWFETKELCEALRWLRVLQQAESAGQEAEYCAPPQLPGFDPHSVARRMQWHLHDTFARIEGRKASGKAAHERYPLGNDYILYSEAQGSRALDDWLQQVLEQPGSAVAGIATATLINTLADWQQQLHGTGGGWINKTPEISRFAPELRLLLGPCRVLYMVRDGAEVVASGLKLKWGSAELLARNWKALLLHTRAGMHTNPAHYLELRYEELVLNPVSTLDKVLTFCGREPCGAELVASFIARFGVSAFDTSRLGSGSSLSAEQRASFEQTAGDLQTALGYG